MMDRRYYKEYSRHLGREMEFVSYGWGGKPVLAVPSQNGKYYDWESFHMVDNLADYIESGKIQLFSFDTIDQETVSDISGDPARRIQRHEAWFSYVIEELLPRVRELNGSWQMPMVTGVSMGAYHAGNFFYRRPDLFDGLVALSGIYDCGPMYGAYSDSLVYENSPADFLRNMPADHPWIGLYNRAKSVICVGQGAWEEELLAGTRRMDEVLKARGIGTWVDYWGTDVNHDWPWWQKQLRYFMPYILNE